MNAHAEIGGNNPPDPIDEALAPYGDYITEAAGWLDGAVVEDEGQMKAVDALTKQIKGALKATKDGQKSEAAPHHDAHKAALERWKPTISDLTGMVKCLIAAVAPYKSRLVEEKRAAVRAAWEAADKARREAEALAAKAAASDIDAQREAAEAKLAAIDATKDAQREAKDTVKGMRDVTRYEITDHKLALHDIAANDGPAMTAFIEEYVRLNHKKRTIGGVTVTTGKVAF